MPKARSLQRPWAVVRVNTLAVGERLKTNRQAVLEECRRRLPPGSALQAHLDGLIDEVSEALSEEQEPRARVIEWARTWAGQLDWDGRAFTLPEELGAVASAIVEALAARQSLSPELSVWITEGVFGVLSEVFRQVLQSSRDERDEERRARAALVSMVSHDIRGPLAAVRSGVQLMLRFPERAAAREKLLASLLESMDRAEGRIQDFVDASRIHAGERLALLVSECDLASELAKIREEVSAFHAERIVLRMPPKLQGYWAPAELRRAVRNLVRNALTYGESGTPVTIALELAGRPGSSPEAEKVRISVHNEGPALGSGPEVRERIFRPFRKGEPKAGSQGWRLGLVLSRGLVEAQGGQLDFRSAPGEGTTFFIELPRDARPYQSFLLHVA